MVQTPSSRLDRAFVTSTAHIPENLIDVNASR